MEKEKFANDRNLGFSTFKEELEADYPTKKSEEEELKSGLRKKKKKPKEEKMLESAQCWQMPSRSQVDED